MYNCVSSSTTKKPERGIMAKAIHALALGVVTRGVLRLS